MATDVNMNTKLQAGNAVNGFVRDNVGQTQINSGSGINPSVQTVQDKKVLERVQGRQNVASQKEEPLDQITENPQKKLQDTISKLNDSLQNFQRNLEFRVDDEVDRVIIQVRDKETDKVIRQIPSEEIIELAKNLQAIQERNENRPEPGGISEGVFLKTQV